MEKKVPHVSISSRVLEAGLFANFVVISNANNSKKVQEFEDLKREQCQRLERTYTQEFINDNRILKGFRDARNVLDVSDDGYPPSPEKLLEYFSKKNKLPAINPLVDIGNYVSLETLLSIGVHRLDALADRVSLRLTTGNEFFIPLGLNDKIDVPAGEFAYIANDNEIICRMDYMQCDRTKLSTATSDCLYIIEGNKNTSVEYVEQATKNIIQLAQKLCNASSVYINPEQVVE